MKAKWWHSEKDRVICELCPRNCRLKEGQRGYCFIRKNVDGEMVLTTYGKTTGFTIDPIDKKPLNHFLPGTPIFGFGTAGCNLGCSFCQNWSSSKTRDMKVHRESATPEEIVRTAKSSGCSSIAFTYNEPIIWAEYAIDIAKIAHAEGLKTVAVTAGYINPEARQDFFEHIDAANVDLKSLSEDFYTKLTLSHLNPVLDTLKWLKHESSVWFEITNLIIPDENDSPEEIDKLCSWILENLGDDVPVHFAAFHPDYKMLNKPRTPKEALIQARTQALQAGIKFAYVGNILDINNQSTYCPECSTLLIERDHYQLGTYAIENGKCGNCGTTIPGLFNKDLGKWGRKRVPLTLKPQEQTMSNSTTEVEDLPEDTVHQMNSAQVNVNEASEIVEQLASTTCSSQSQTFADGRTFPTAEPKTDYSEEEIRIVLSYVRSLVTAAVSHKPAPAALPLELAESPAFGVFVSLKRGSILRACRGHWGDSNAVTLGALLTSAAVSAASSDARFPSISAAELPLLTVEISLMYAPQPITAQGQDRIKAVKVGKHGLVIANSGNQGILLPHVATENNWNELTFLQHLANKAGLPPDAWADPDSQLMTFQALLLISQPQQKEFECLQVSPQKLEELMKLANLIIQRKPQQVQVSSELVKPQPGLTGIYVENQQGFNTTTLNQTASLLDLLQQGVQSLEKVCTAKQKQIGPITRFDLFSQPIPLTARDYPNRHHTLVNSAVLAQRGGQSSFIVPGKPRIPQDKVGAALMSMSVSPEQWHAGEASLLAFSARSVRTNLPQNQTLQQDAVRRPAVAGSFYPANRESLEKELNHYLLADKIPNRYLFRALMLPHAGWRFCGDIIARTLNQAVIPDTVIVIGPKHTRPGAKWSAAGHKVWAYPHCNIPILHPLAEKLAEVVPGLTCENDAHRDEHSIEVLLPFLHRLNPRINVLPITVGHSEYNELNPLSDILASILVSNKIPPLIVVSSDMNHYAPEEKNRQLDQIALQAMLSGNPEELYTVCHQNKISMCGMLPAVTVLQALHKTGTAPKVHLIDYNTSVRVSKNPSAVVGYAGVLIQ
jgi:AmmeMemoRadiSam system radical SAM enzyme/AmmeMemoRadiSam system protein B/AmmeMemoRadiSam system protein A